MSTRRRKPLLLAPAAMRHWDDDERPSRGARDDGLGWIGELLQSDPGYTQRRMFGCDANYLDGLIYLVTATKGEPWNGLLVCTSRERQAALQNLCRSLAPHRVLGKWLYISQDQEDFETTARAMTRLALARDGRLGVVPKHRKSKSKRAKRKA